MIFDYFDSIQIISLRHHGDRLARLRGQLQGLARAKRITVMEAIHGDQLPAPAYWKQGNGAWGCLQSHIRCLQSIWQAGHKRTLILEDDAVIDPSCTEWLEAFLPMIPQDWGQIYLGGQHTQDPDIQTGYFGGKSINRTHAYAVQRAAIPKILQHIQHAPDYIANEWRHVDHQLEVAHQRKDWSVICPEYWCFGQGENRSAINGRNHPEKWWDWLPKDILGLIPWVVVGPETSDEDLKPFRDRIHFGWKLATDNRSDVGMQSGMKRRTRQALKESSKAVAQEAWDMRRIPAVAVKDDEQREIFLATMKPALITLAEAGKFNPIKWTEALK